MVMHHRKLQPRERQILRAIARYRGKPAQNEWLFAEMYREARSTPEPAKMYSALKVALSYARKKLQGSGAMIRNFGYGRGYVIVSEVEG
jgi:DNA-binding response OmpR family regulator